MNRNKIILICGAGISWSVGTRLRVARPRNRASIPGTGRIFFSYSKCPYSPWESTLPHVQWVLGICVLLVKQLVYEAGHFHVVLRLWNAWSLYSTLPSTYVVWYFTEHRKIYSFTFTQYYLSPIFFPLRTRSSFCVIELANFAENRLSISMGGYRECHLISAVCL